MKIPIDSNIEAWIPAMITHHHALFPPQASFIDVGGYHGEFAAILQKTGIFENGIIFEPNPENVATIQERFRGHPSIKVIPSACGESSETLKMHCSGPSYTASLLPYNNPVEEVKTYEVPVEPLDQFIPEAEHPNVGFIKIDTQGNDLSVLRGARRLISTAQPWILAEMIYTDLYKNQCCPHEIGSFLAEMDYVKVAEFNEFYSPAGWLAWSDACFVPRRHTHVESQTFTIRPSATDIHHQWTENRLKTCAKLLTGKL